MLAHPSFPWQDEAISICLHKANVWIDLSGWSPKYFPPQLVQYANTQLREKVLFGSDFPLLTPERWLADFAEAPFKDEVRPLILKENAAGCSARLRRLRPFEIRIDRSFPTDARARPARPEVGIAERRL